jgi:anti-repressor protein
MGSVIHEGAKMNQSITPFEFESKQVRVVNIDGEPWWIARDVCDAINIRNVTQAVDRLDNDERSMSNIGRQGDAWIINESGIYTLIMRSDKPEARRFRKWVTSEVLPSIRKTGKYAVEQFSRLELIDMARDSELKRLESEKKLALQAPVMDAFQKSEDAGIVYTISEIAKSVDCGMGEKKLFEFLRREGVLCSSADKWNQPFQWLVDKGAFKLRPSVGNDGLLHDQPVALPSGRVLIVGLLYKRGHIERRTYLNFKSDGITANTF